MRKPFKYGQKNAEEKALKCNKIIITLQYDFLI